MRNIFFFCIFGFLLAFICSCSPLRTPPPPLPTNTAAAATITPTPTEVWFPPTSTPTTFPTPTGVITPTLDIQPEFGENIFVDNFNDPTLWTQTRGPVGSVSVANNELTIAISQTRGYLYSLRMETYLSDYYAEITTSPSICRGEDEYGLLLRVTDSYDFYRYSLTCDGRVRLDKYYRSTPSSPQGLIFSSEVPPGAPSLSRIGVSLSGRDMHFYINDIYQFSVTDQSITIGTIGVFARASGEGALTVNFSDLIVSETTEFSD